MSVIVRHSSSLSIQIRIAWALFVRRVLTQFEFWIRNDELWRSFITCRVIEYRLQIAIGTSNLETSVPTAASKWALNNLHQSPIRTILYILLEGRRNRRLLWWSQTWTTLHDPNRRSSRSASPIHLSTGRNKVFANSHSNVRVVRWITRLDGRSLSYALVRSNCNKLVITWPLGRLADLSPSWPCDN